MHDALGLMGIKLLMGIDLIQLFMDGGGFSFLIKSMSESKYHTNPARIRPF